MFLPRAEFNKNRARANGLNRYCKVCDREYQREHKEKKHHDTVARNE